MTKAPPTREQAIEAMARAILKARFYDYEPADTYESLEAFYAGLDAQHTYEARDEAGDAYDALLAMGAIREPETMIQRIDGIADDLMAGKT